MDKQTYKFSKIGSFKDVIGDVIQNARYKGRDENDEPIYDTSLPLPTIEFTGTVKLHGTNAGFCYSTKSGYWAQSRERVITSGDDNYGWANFCDVYAYELQWVAGHVLKNHFEKEGFGKNDLWSCDLFIEEFYKSNDWTVILYGEWAGCFSYKTPILLADGTTKPIGVIVNGKEQVEVLTYNLETERLEPKKVINWFKNGRTDDWLTLSVRKRKRGGKSNNITVTPNHKIFTKVNGEIKEIKASQLKVGDVVFTAGEIFSYNVEQFLRGSLLGDASFSDYGHIQVGHSEDNQAFYNEFISKLLLGISSKHNAVSGHGSDMIVHHTKSLGQIKNLYDDLVVEGKKSPNREYLNKLNPMGLAVWYMDDGSLVQAKEGRQPQCELHTLGFTKEENDVIRDWFNDHGYECYVTTRRNYNQERYSIRFTTKGTKAFLFTISPYIIEGFNYKLPETMQKIPKVSWFNSLNEYENGLVETVIDQISLGNPYADKGSFYLEKYDIQIEGNSNYFANRILVHNSGIQSGVGISQINTRSFFLFDAKLVLDDGREIALDIKDVRDHNAHVFNIYDYPTWAVTVDFNNPKSSVELLESLTNAVGKECPVSKALGVKDCLTGEGIVFKGEFNNKIYRFKSKTDDHKVVKQKELIPVNVEKLESVHKFVDYACTPNRFEQGLQVVFGANTPDIQKLGEVLKWITNDILEEEKEAYESNGLDKKDISKAISFKAKEMFMKRINEI